MNEITPPAQPRFFNRLLLIITLLLATCYFFIVKLRVFSGYGARVQGLDMLDPYQQGTIYGSVVGDFLFTFGIVFALAYWLGKSIGKKRSVRAGKVFYVIALFFGSLFLVSYQVSKPDTPEMQQVQYTLFSKGLVKGCIENSGTQYESVCAQVPNQKIFDLAKECDFKIDPVNKPDCYQRMQAMFKSRMEELSEKSSR